MGFQTTLGILNDYWYEYKKHPQIVVDVIREGMAGFQGYQHCGITVCQSHHADYHTLYISGGNMLVELSPQGMENLRPELKEELLAEASRLLLHVIELNKKGKK